MHVLHERADVTTEDYVADTGVDLTVASSTPAVVLRIQARTSSDTERLVDALTAATTSPVPVVLDLRGADVISELSAVESTQAAAERLGVDWCVVSTRRRPLSAVVGGPTPVLFATARDALQALLLARQGYGPGWARR